MMNFLFCTVLPLGAFKVDQTHKFDNFLNLIQLFPMTLYSVLVEIKVVGITLKTTLNFMINSLEYTVFTPRASEVGKI